MPGGFEHIGRVRIGDDIAVVIGPHTRIVGEFALAVAADQSGHDLHCLGRRPAPLQSQAQHFHTHQLALLRLLQPGVQGLVADDHLMLVKTVFIAPAPVGPRAHVAPGRAGLGHADELALQLRAGRILPLRMLDQGLALAGRTIAVFGKEGLPLPGRRSQGDHGIATHGHHIVPPSHLYSRGFTSLIPLTFI